MLSANEGNGAYSFFARRFCVANTCDLLDGTVPAASVRVIVNTSTVVCEAEERPVEDGPEEEKAAEISRDGGEELECDFTWTVDGRAHNTRIFRSLSLCREFARSVAEANEGNVRFAFYARRYVQLDSRDFMDPSVDVRDVPLARRVRLA